MAIWKSAIEAVSAGLHPVLLAVVEHRGSVPGKTGAMMLVWEGGVEGTIGGGLVEHRWISRAKKLREAILEDFSHDGVLNDSVCSGSQLIAAVPLGPEDLSMLRHLEKLERAGRCATIELSPQGLSPTREEEPGVSREGSRWSCRLAFGRSEELYIAGGGHVSLALSRIMSTLPFRINVFDTRPELPTMEANRWAHSRSVIRWDDFPALVSEGPHSWVVIMTHGHRDDEDVLRGLLDLDLRYLGLMGSAAKVSQLFTRLREEGLDPEKLAGVHAPIGLPIRSHTPEEIAVSIAAEIIGIRNHPLA